VEPNLLEDRKLKLKQKGERRRLAEFNLQPNFNYAFGAWGPEELRWRLDGVSSPVHQKALFNSI